MTRTIDPDSQAILDLIIASDRPPIHAAGLEAARAGMRASRQLFGAPPPPTRIRDVTAPGPAGAIPIRLYRPLDLPIERPLPLLVYFHGGGWVLGDIETGDALCATLAQSVGIAVAAVEYRLAPEFPFPAGLEDCFAALDWLTAQVGDLGIFGARVAVAGDSAGGNMAAVSALRARDRGEPLCAQILLYPVTDLTMRSESYQRNASGYMLTAETMRWFRDQYLGDTDASDWRASPLHAERLNDLAPALIVTCGLDPLCDEGAAYAARLVTAGVPVRYLPYPCQLHGFALWGKTVRDATVVLAQVAKELRQRLL
ncbi:alpha/beta hydrolase [soil metagenome]